QNITTLRQKLGIPAKGRRIAAHIDNSARRKLLDIAEDLPCTIAGRIKQDSVNFTAALLNLMHAELGQIGGHKARIGQTELGGVFTTSLNHRLPRLNARHFCAYTSERQGKIADAAK